MSATRHVIFGTGPASARPGVVRAARAGGHAARDGGSSVPPARQSAARESVGMLYQFTEPWVVSSDAIESAFGLKPTPITEGIRRTIEWWREARPTAGA